MGRAVTKTRKTAQCAKTNISRKIALGAKTAVLPAEMAVLPVKMVTTSSITPYTLHIAHTHAVQGRGLVVQPHGEGDQNLIFHRRYHALATVRLSATQAG